MVEESCDENDALRCDWSIQRLEKQSFHYTLVVREPPRCNRMSELRWLQTFCQVVRTQLEPFTNISGVETLQPAEKGDTDGEG